MINTMIYNEYISSEDLNTLMDKSSNIAIDGCNIHSGGYVSNLNARAIITNCRLFDTNLVLRDDSQNKMEFNSHTECGVRLVSVVSGYAYTHQITCCKSLGVGVHS
jgi:hypothetical protein